VIVHICNPSSVAGKGTKMAVRGWPQTRSVTLSPKDKAKRAGIVAQLVEAPGPEFKPQNFQQQKPCYW
jgi:hypothetical protein